MRTAQTITVLAILMLAVSLIVSQAASAQTGFSVPKDVRKIFDDHCVSCHGGKTPAAGHNYSTDADLEKLLGMPSSEKSGVAMIDPGSPAKSYLVMKITGASGIVGSRMPLAGTDLTAAQIKVIEDWISGMSTKAAPAPPAASSSGTKSQDPPKTPGSPMMTQASPAAQASTGGDPKNTADEMFDGAYTYMRRCSGCHGKMGEGVSLFGPALAKNAFIMTGDAEAIGEVILNGRKYKEMHYPAYSGMPAWQFIRGGELQALINYLKGPLQQQ